MTDHSFVMAGLVPAIQGASQFSMDHRIKSGGDEVRGSAA
jgi:hypothetical protein